MGPPKNCDCFSVISAKSSIEIQLNICIFDKVKEGRAIEVGGG